MITKTVRLYLLKWWTYSYCKYRTGPTVNVPAFRFWANFESPTLCTRVSGTRPQRLQWMNTLNVPTLLYWNPARRFWKSCIHLWMTLFRPLHVYLGLCMFVGLLLRVQHVHVFTSIHKNVSAMVQVLYMRLSCLSCSHPPDHHWSGKVIFEWLRSA